MNSRAMACLQSFLNRDWHRGTLTLDCEDCLEIESILIAPTSQRARAREERCTVEITTSKGQVVLLDACDVARLPSGHLHVSTRGYARIEQRKRGSRSNLTIHRFVLDLVKGDGKIVDHINGNKLDNRRENLRLATRSLNGLNQHNAYVGNAIGLLGVTHDPRRTSKPFRAAMMVNQKHVHIGVFATAEEAHEAYIRAKEPLIATDRDALCLDLMTDAQALATWERMKAVRKAYVAAIIEKVPA